ncbi:uncharacterized protein LOC113170104 isoform X2 [Anabas testudineus]|uniref:uncharacterized protein LOC113170104 isoform X2 n=1 Tax=Anabas testudineus TaxID=64144 RepID=UPI000E45E347|nr:uncharacterized protein LOC113170104 isoform X2 [Anabas testudineus]
MTHRGEATPPRTCSVTSSLCLTEQSRVERTEKRLERFKHRLERFKQRLERLKSHHNRCEQRFSLQSPGVNLGKRPLQKKKTGKQLKMMKAGDEGSDLCSPKSKSHGHVDGIYDADDEGSDLCSPKNKSHCQDDDDGMMGPSDTDDQSPGVKLGKRPLQKKKTGKRMKMMNAGDEGSDLCSPKSKSHGHNAGTYDTNDQSPGMVERHLLKKKKKIGKQSKMAKSEEKKSSAKGKRPWTEPERRAVKKHLGRFIAERRVPGKEQCITCLTEEEVLGQRSWKDVKNFVNNRIVTLNRRSASQQFQL